MPAEKRPKICPKIEKPQAFTNIEGIIAKSQALMVARGDLGVELGLNRVPFAQKLLIQRAKQAGLFVITATQMVESMIESPVPTRAEVSDLMTLGPPWHVGFPAQERRVGRHGCCDVEW